MANPVVHFEIVGKDAKKLHEYYGNLFGWQINADNPMNYGLVSPGERGIGGGIGPTDGPNWVTIYVEVDDIQGALDKAVALGGEVLVPVTEVPGMVTFAQFRDPEGNAVGLVKSANA